MKKQCATTLFLCLLMLAIEKPTCVAQESAAQPSVTIRNRAKFDIKVWLVDPADRSLSKKVTLPHKAQHTFLTALSSDRLVVNSGRLQLAQLVGTKTIAFDFDGQQLGRPKPEIMPRLGFEGTYSRARSELDVKSLKKGSLADQMGLQVGDAILAINGNAMQDVDSYELGLIRAFEGNGKLVLTVRLAGTKRSLPMVTWLW